MTEQELLRALQDALAEPGNIDGTLAAADVERALGIGRKKANELIKRLIQAGEWEYAGREMRPAMDQVLRPVPVYRPVAA